LIQNPNVTLQPWTSTWAGFKKLLGRVYPTPNTQIELLDDEDQEPK